ncbi:MAG TPA: hypothetical protein VHB21_14625 [Minicystis sp.]|nr:hypothetical protein [Minicystis sp.]
MALTLPKQAFVALAAVAWSDGSFRKNEGAALLHAAKQCGLGGDDLAEVERSTKAAVSLDGFDAAALGPWERIVTYALASWLACLDGVQSTSESAALKALGDRLELADGVRKRAASAAFDIAVLPASARPDKYDFGALTARLGEKMPQHAP